MDCATQRAVANSEPANLQFWFYPSFGPAFFASSVTLVGGISVVDNWNEMIKRNIKDHKEVARLSNALRDAEASYRSAACEEAKAKLQKDFAAAQKRVETFGTPGPRPSFQ